MSLASLPEKPSTTALAFDDTSFRIAWIFCCRTASSFFRCSASRACLCSSSVCCSASAFRCALRSVACWVCSASRSCPLMTFQLASVPLARVPLARVPPSISTGTLSRVSAACRGTSSRHLAHLVTCSVSGTVGARRWRRRAFDDFTKPGPVSARPNIGRIAA